MISFDPVRLTRTNTLDFKPPEPNRLIQKLFHWFLPVINKQVLKGLSIQITDESLNRLKALNGQRCLILPNHPSEWDPCVIFDVSRQLGEHFYFVAAREVFDYSFGIRGWFFQKLGVYSLVRGSNDRRSMKTSMEILAQNLGRLVIFVEGEISNQNESLLPLESGVVQLAFMTLNDAYKETGKNLEALPSLFICPVSIRYQYETDGLSEAIETAISGLENATAIKPTNGKHFARVQKLAEVVLSGAAGQVGFPFDATLPLAEQVSRLSNFMLVKLEQVLNLLPQAELSYLDRVRRIRNKVDKILSKTVDEHSSDYQRHLFQHQKAVLKNVHQDLDRVVNFIAIYDGYLQPDMSENRYVEILRRLEREVYGAFKLAHPRNAQVVVAEPIDLKQHFQQFLDDKKYTVQQLTLSIEQHIFSGLS